METSYTIQMASKISGVGVHTIRAWEKRYKALEPKRDSSGHRTYTKTDIEKLILLSELCLLGYAISKVAIYSIEELKVLLKDLGKESDSDLSSIFHLTKEVPQIDFEQSLSILKLALRAKKLDVINQELSKLKHIATSREYALDIILPLVNETLFLKQNDLFTQKNELALLSLFHFHSGHFFYCAPQRSSGIAMIAQLQSENNDVYPYLAGLLGHFYQLNLHFSHHFNSVDTLIESINIIEPELLLLSAFPFAKSENLSYFELILEKISSKYTGEFLIISAPEILRAKFPGRRFHFISTAIELDNFLAQRKGQSL